MNAKFFPGAGVIIWLAYVMWIAGFYGPVLSSFCKTLRFPLLRYQQRRFDFRNNVLPGNYFQII